MSRADMPGPNVAIVAAQFLLPTLLLYWQWRRRCGTGLHWLARTAMVQGYLALIGIAGLWLLLPVLLPYIFITLGMLFAIRDFRAARIQAAAKPAQNSIRMSTVATGLLAVGLWSVNAYLVKGWHVPDDKAVHLEFPLRGGAFYVANGGANIALNPHLKTLSDARFAAYRGQSFAVGIVQLNRFGLRATGMMPAEPDRYEIFGTSVVAPCSGVVVHAENWREDLTPPQSDQTLRQGNHIMLKCDEHVVLLAHLKQGSILVQNGETVDVGQVLARVGNSGATDEPHLHVHVQKPGSLANSLDGRPLWPIFAKGKFLVRNQIVFN